MINENLKKICEEKDISAYRLAKITQLPISVVAKIIRDEVKNPRLDTIIKIADALDVTLDELVGRKRKQTWGNLPRKIKRLLENYMMDEFIYHRKQKKSI